MVGYSVASGLSFLTSGPPDTPVLSSKPVNVLVVLEWAGYSWYVVLLTHTKALSCAHADSNRSSISCSFLDAPPGENPGSRTPFIAWLDRTQENASPDSEVSAVGPGTGTAGIAFKQGGHSNFSFRRVSRVWHFQAQGQVVQVGG